MTELKTRVLRLLWSRDPAALSPIRRRLLNAARLIYAVARDVAEGQLNLHAMSLVYTTLLSLVPLLALAFSVLKGFGVHNQIQPTLLAFLAPLGTQGEEITRQIIGFVDNIRVGVLGAVGLGLLIYTVTALLQKVEDAFNHVWHVKRGRPLAQRISQYLSVLTVGPVLVFAALGLTATLLNTEFAQSLTAVQPMGTLLQWLGKLLPYVLVILAFAFVYVLMPNTRVAWSSALVGGLVGGILWQTLGWGFATFIAHSGQYTAIYASFAIVILAMIWLYLNWLIVLIGASVAFYHQHPGQLAASRPNPQPSNRVQEKLALLTMALIGRRFRQGGPAWTLDALSARLGVPVLMLEPLLQTLVRHGFLAEAGEGQIAYLPARDLEGLTVRELLNCVRMAREEEGANLSHLPADAVVDELLSGLDGAIAARLDGMTVWDLSRPGESRPEDLSGG